MPVASPPTSPFPPVDLALSRPTLTKRRSDESERSLVELFGRVQEGDADAFAQLHARTWRSVRRAVVRILGSADLADDVLQDTYLQAWLQRHQFQPGQGSVLGWLVTIGRRRAIDRIRTLARGQAHQVRYSTDPTLLTDSDHQDAVTNQISSTAIINEACQVLTDLQHEALLLTYGANRTPSQAAALLGIPVPTLKSRVHAAITRLRHHLTATLPAP